MDKEKELEKLFKELEDAEVSVHTFDPIEALPVEELFNEDFRHDAMVFDAGITEAVKRLLRKHKDYGLIDFMRTILDVEYEGEKIE